MRRIPNPHSKEEMRRAIQFINADTDGVTQTTIDEWNTAYDNVVALRALNGLIKCNGSGTFSSITDSHTNWDTAYTHSLVNSGNPHSVTKTEVGLGNVDNVQQQPIDADLTAIAALSGSTGFLQKTAENTWSLTSVVTTESDPVFSAWQTSYDHHANWDTAYGWGNHAGLYTPIAHKTTEDAINGLVFVNGAGTYSAKVIGTDVQAYSVQLKNIAALAVTDSNIIVANGTTWVAETGTTARTSLGLGTGDSVTFASLTSKLTPPAGTTTAGSAPLKLTSQLGVLTSPEAGAFEFGTDDLYFTISTGPARQKVILSTGLTNTRVPFATTNGRVTDSANFYYDGSYLYVNGLQIGGTGGTVPAVINSNTTYYVATTGSDSTGDGSSGNPWATLSKAFSYLADFTITPDATVTVSLGDGRYNTGVTVNHPYGNRIAITGANTYDKTISSVQSSSGSSGNWTYVINVNNVTNVTNTDYVLIYYSSISAGTNRECLVGCHPITSVDAINNRITFTSKIITANAASGAIIGTCAVIKTVLYNTGSTVITISPSSSLMSFAKLVLEGNGTSNGLYVNSGSVATCYSTFGIYNMLYGLYLASKGTVSSFLGIISDCNRGINTISSCTVNGYGSSTVTGCTTGIYLYGCTFLWFGSSPAIIGCTTGVNVQLNSAGSIGPSTFLQNGTDSSTSLGGEIQIF